jgi:hypothetical protein
MFVLMSFEASSQAPADLDPRVERCRRVVDGLVEVGMNLVRTLDPANGPASVRDPFLAYCRISRALRLTLVLEARLAALVEAGGPAAQVSERAQATRISWRRPTPSSAPAASGTARTRTRSAGPCHARWARSPP